MAKKPQGRIYHHCLLGQLSTTFSNVTEIGQSATPSCSRSQPATNYAVKNGRSNWLAITLILFQGNTPEHLFHSESASSQMSVQQPGSEPRTSWTQD